MLTILHVPDTFVNYWFSIIFFQKNNKWCHWSLEFTTYLFRILRQLLSHHHVWYLECCGNICIIFFAPYKMNANSSLWQPHHLLYGISNYFLFSSWVVVVFLVVEENDDDDGLQMNEWDLDEPKSILMHSKKICILKTLRLVFCLPWSRVKSSM